MEEMEIELQDGIKIVLSKEKAQQIVLEKLGLNTTTTKPLPIPGERKVALKGFRGKNIQKVYDFLAKKGSINGSELTNIMGRGGQSYKFMDDLEQKGVVVVEPKAYPKLWIYQRDKDDFKEQEERIQKNIVEMMKVKNCKECGNELLRIPTHTNYMWGRKEFCNIKCRVIHNNNNKIKSTPQTRERIVKKKHLLNPTVVLEAIKRLDLKSKKSDLKGIAKELEYYSKNLNRIGTHLWGLKKNGLIIVKDGKERNCEYTAMKGVVLAKKLGIKVLKEKMPETKTEEIKVPVGWLNETLSNDNAYYLLESCIYGRTIGLNDASIVGVVNTEREWETFVRNALTHQPDIVKQYNTKGFFRWSAQQKTLKFKKN